MRYQNVRVTRSEAHILETAFLPWEVPMLQALYGAENVVLGDMIDVERRDKSGAPKPAPTPESEFDRLVAVYKSAEEGGVPLAHQVYGAPPTGVRALMKAMEDATPPEPFAESAALVEDDVEALL